MVVKIQTKLTNGDTQEKYLHPALVVDHIRNMLSRPATALISNINLQLLDSKQT